MESRFILPVMKSIQRVFEQMFHSPVDIGEPGIGRSEQPGYDITANIGLNGDVEGSISIRLPMRTAQRLTSLLTGSECAEDNAEEMSDAIGETLNMISGGAKAHFTGLSVGMQCPSVVFEASHPVCEQKNLNAHSIPCNCEYGEFTVEIAIAEISPDSGPAMVAADAADERSYSN